MQKKSYKPKTEQWLWENQVTRTHLQLKTLPQDPPPRYSHNVSSLATKKNLSTSWCGNSWFHTSAFSPAEFANTGAVIHGKCSHCMRISSNQEGRKDWQQRPQVRTLKTEYLKELSTLWCCSAVNYRCSCVWEMWQCFILQRNPSEESKWIKSCLQRKRYPRAWAHQLNQ